VRVSETAGDGSVNRASSKQDRPGRARADARPSTTVPRGGPSAADGIRAVKTAENEAERERLDAYRDVTAQLLLGMAARELTANFERIDIDHLSVNPDGLGALFETLIGAGTKKLEADAGGAR
jgi:hypothetical protein